MRISIALDTGEISTVDVPEDLTIDTLKALLVEESGIPKEQQVLVYDGQQLASDEKTLQELRVSNGDLLRLVNASTITQSRRLQRGVAHGRRGAPNRPRSPESIRLEALADPLIRERLRNHSSELADALEDHDRYHRVWNEIERAQDEAEAEKQLELDRLHADPLDPESQSKIAEIIRERGVMDNLQHAIQYTPEVFGRVHMLYITVEVNSTPVKAFVDSGAQATVMSPSCAEKCGIIRLLDKQFSGLAKGVGTAQILGRVHNAAIKIGKSFLPSSFTVMEGKDVDLLLGLDMLKRHQAILDLNRDVLIINGEEVRFLPESEIPRPEETEPTIEGPNGTQIGTKSGAIISTSNDKFGQVSSRQSTTSPEQLNAGTSEPAPQVPEEHVTQLVSMGYSRSQVLWALQAANGSLEEAANLLYSAF